MIDFDAPTEALVWFIYLGWRGTLDTILHATRLNRTTALGRRFCDYYDDWLTQ